MHFRFLEANMIKIPFQSFRGLINKTPNGKKGYFCYLISLFQLFFHIEDIKNYLNQQNLQNTTEILLSNLIKKIYSSRNDSSVSIKEFVSNWKGWYTKSGHLQNIPEDIDDFFQFLLNSCSDNFKKMFLIHYNSQSDFEIGSDHYNTYFLRLLINDTNVQSLINNHILENKIKFLPNCLFLFLQRSNGTFFNDIDIRINSFINVNNINYKFIGCSIFIGSLQNGHYITMINFHGKYVLFDDERVSNLFYYQNCSSLIKSMMQNADEMLSKRSVLFGICKIQ